MKAISDKNHHYLFKTRLKKKNCILLFTFLLIPICCYTLPSFIYNHLEHEFRANFSIASELQDTADELITIRQLGKNEATTDENFENMTKEIEKDLEESITYLDKAAEAQTSQEKIPLLPNKYREYHEKKSNLVFEHKQLGIEFLTIKKNEHLLTETIQRLFTTQQYMRNLNFEQDLSEAVEYLEYNTLRVSTQTKKLYEDDLITSGVYDYLNNQNEPIIQVMKQFELVIENQSWEKFDETKIIYSPPLNDEELFTLFANSNKTKRESDLQQYFAKEEIHYSKMGEAGMFYLDNHLSFDPISKLLSFFTNIYPLNKEHFESPSIVVPSDLGDPDLISLNM